MVGSVVVGVAMVDDVVKFSLSRRQHRMNNPLVHEPPMHNGLNLLEKRVHKDPNSVDQYSTVRNKAHHASYRDPACSLEKLVQNQDSVPPRSTSIVLNFSHFSRPASMARATVQSHEPWKETGQPGSARKPVDEPHCVEKCSNDVNGDNEGKEGSETVKSNEPVGVCSSVCSGNSGERASNDMTINCKRKFSDGEDFECQSQDAEDESLGAKTTAASRGGSGSKRSRATEVHNLSERVLYLLITRHVQRRIIEVINEMVQL